MRLRISIAATFVLIPLFARADALNDLRASLAQLIATTSVHGSLDVTSTTRNNDDDRAAPGKATVGFDAGDAGLHVIYPRPLLMQAGQEARGEAIDPERETPVRSGVAQVRPLHLAELLDAAAALGVTLEISQLVQATASNYGGRPARLLVLKVTPRLAKAASKRIKKIESTLSVWLGDDGIPLGGERMTVVKASVLLMSFESEQKESWVYSRAGDRLVTVRYETTRKSDGLGQHGSSQTTEVLRIQP